MPPQQQSELPPPSILTSSQLSTFLQHIGLPTSLQQSRYAADSVRDLHLLTQLHIHTISTLPYENLWLHYSATHRNTITPTSTFANAILAGRGRGGYCFQLSLLFNHMLRALGFPAYLTPVRIRHRDTDGVPQGTFSGWVHLVNIVSLSCGSKFSLDVGFGGDGPTRPMQLVENAPQTNLGSQEVRYARRWLDGQVRREEETKVWVYEYRNSKGVEWNAFYAFDDRVEGLEGDFSNLNWYTGAHPESFQTFTPLVVKFLRRPVAEGGGEEVDQEIYGKRMLVGATVKQNLGGKTEMLLQCTEEEERVQALEKWFGIRLTEEEKTGIRGWGSEVGTQPGRDEVWHVRRGKEWSYEWRGPVGE